MSPEYIQTLVISASHGYSEVSTKAVPSCLPYPPIVAEQGQDVAKLNLQVCSYVHAEKNINSFTHSHVLSHNF